MSQHVTIIMSIICLLIAVVVYIIYWRLVYSYKIYFWFLKQFTINIKHETGKGLEIGIERISSL